MTACANEQSSTFIKDPDAYLDYSVDWSAWLGDDTISSSAWFVPDGLDDTNPSIASGKTVVWLSGGSVGTTYDVVNRITTAQGRIDDRTLRINIQEK